MKITQLWMKNSVYQRFWQDFKEKRIKQLDLLELQGSAFSFFISSLLLEGKMLFPLVFLTRDTESALHLSQDILSFTGWQENKHIFIFPSHEVLPYEDISKDVRIIEQRIKVLSVLSLLLQSAPPDKGSASLPLIIISSYKAILPKIIPLNNFSRQHWKLQLQEKLLPENLIHYLHEQGYQSSPMIEYRGQFSQRGGIIDFFPFTEENPIRIELNGDRVESIRFFDLESQRSIKKVDSVLLLPQRELGQISDEENIRRESFFEYLPSQTDMIVEQFSEFENTIRAFEKESQRYFMEKQKNNENKILPPEHYYLSWQQVKDSLYEKNQLITLEPWKKQHRGIKNGREEYQIKTELAKTYFGNLDFFFEDLKKWQQEKRNIVVLASNRGRALRLAEIFDDRSIKNYQIMPLTEVHSQPGSVCLSYGQVNYGFSIPALNLLFVTDQEIFGKERDKSIRPKKVQGRPFYQVDELKIGDYVVHIHHGIGRYAGIQSRSREGVKKEYLLIKYAADDELYVPVEQLNLVHKYIGIKGQPPKLYRLGGSSWRGVKRRVKASIQKMAHELFELYRKRKNIQGFSFSVDSVWQQELEMAFPFEETPDQGKALVDVKKDMESPQPMERLICGDVGYGKTEIAIRAAFKAVMDSKQVAVLAPTTILAQQHWENFTERIKAFPVRIEMLSRFKSRREQQEIISDLKRGKIDIIIGTHRLVQTDVMFQDLGLLIVDEEQRFGVAHKERIKKLKEQVDSLTLTATPIPRTLYFSLIGVREMSLMNTPPEQRLPIITYLSERTDEVMRQAIRREIERGGQVYYVHNRVQNMDDVAEKLKQMVPEARIMIAHGQMPEIELENIMVDFLNRVYDVLLCTTIIEIGLDIPNVNTIIIDEAHQFGLAQLYQLRGRVGRADRRAYAYLLYPSKEILTENAQKRLQAIREFSDLGSGFRLAMRDLEIRGAGNLLGREQHGFVSEIGFNYYCQLLEDSIHELKQIEAGAVEKIREEPEIEIKLDSYIPDNYISDTEVRISFYQKLSRIRTENELSHIRDELQDIYGPYPREVENLLTIISMKLKLKNHGVTHIRITPGVFSFKYPPGALIAQKLNNKFTDVQTPSLQHTKKGSYHEFKLLSEGNNEPGNANTILNQSDSFLDRIFSSSDS